MQVFYLKTNLWFGDIFSPDPMDRPVTKVVNLLKVGGVIFAYPSVFLGAPSWGNPNRTWKVIWKRKPRRMRTELVRDFVFGWIYVSETNKSVSFFGRNKWKVLFCLWFPTKTKKHIAIPCKLQETHEKMQCWCKTNGDEKANSIQEAQNHIKVCRGRRVDATKKTLQMKPWRFRLGMVFWMAILLMEEILLQLRLEVLSHCLQGFNTSHRWLFGIFFHQQYHIGCLGIG